MHITQTLPRSSRIFQRPTKSSPTLKSASYTINMVKKASNKDPNRRERYIMSTRFHWRTSTRAKSRNSLCRNPSSALVVMAEEERKALSRPVQDVMALV
jgi:hypothetical protein